MLRPTRTRVRVLRPKPGSRRRHCTSRGTRFTNRCRHRSSVLQMLTRCHPHLHRLARRPPPRRRLRSSSFCRRHSHPGRWTTTFLRRGSIPLQPSRQGHILLRQRRSRLDRWNSTTLPRRMPNTLSLRRRRRLLLNRGAGTLVCQVPTPRSPNRRRRVLPPRWLGISPPRVACGRSF